MKKIPPRLNQRPEPIPLTPQKFTQLQQHKAKLQADQEQILKRLKLAREQGDLSENGAYKYAKFELGSNRRQLSQINHLLTWGKVIDAPTKKDQVSFGHTITLSGDKRQITFMLVSQHESDPSSSKLSDTSPYGQAVMGKRLGEQVKVLAPGGEFVFTITSIS